MTEWKDVMKPDTRKESELSPGEPAGKEGVKTPQDLLAELFTKVRAIAKEAEELTGKIAGIEDLLYRKKSPRKTISRLYREASEAEMEASELSDRLDSVEMALEDMEDVFGGKVEEGGAVE